jgi:hypothetical protein
MLGFLPPLLAAGPEQAPCQHCEGQNVWRDVVCHECKLVPETRQIKKTVYEVREVPFCLHKPPPLFGHHGACCDECRECGKVRYKKVLLKKEIVCEEICTSKCVVEEFADRVPCRECCPSCLSNAPPPLKPVVSLELADQELAPIPLRQVRLK